MVRYRMINGILTTTQLIVHWHILTHCNAFPSKNIFNLLLNEWNFTFWTFGFINRGNFPATQAKRFFGGAIFVKRIIGKRGAKNVVAHLVVMTGKCGFFSWIGECILLATVGFNGNKANIDPPPHHTIAYSFQTIFHQQRA